MIVLIQYIRIFQVKSLEAKRVLLYMRELYYFIKEIGGAKIKPMQKRQIQQRQDR